MKLANWKLGIYLLFTQLIACVEPYDVRSVNFERAVVVEGRITNKAGSNYVKLSFTRPIEEQENVPLSGATVWVEGTEGGQIRFNESEPGYYQPSEEIAGREGINYQLFFTTKEGRQYQSGLQELIASPPIDSIYNIYLEKLSSTSGDVYKGIQFFIATHDETNKAKHFKYEWEETYEAYAPYPSFYEFFPDADTAVARKKEVSPCYVSAQSSSILIGTTANLNISRLAEMPIRYITSDTDHLRVAYSILVRQFVISSEAYSFYQEMLENNEDNESLFDKQLGVVVGNITSIGDPDETVLGYFEVAGVSEKRAFVRYEELDRRFPWPEGQFPCSASQQIVSIGTIDSLEYYAVGKQYGIIDAAYGKRPNEPLKFAAKLAPRYCTDCRFRGPATKPEYWIY